jgi:POT family proton-dependent oligopeptide transporter
LIVGNGFFKPNISTIVGRLYEPGDHRRDRGFTIFYMGINVGALFAPLVCGYIGEVYGWRYGFGLAGVGMLLGLVQFLLGQHKLHGVADPPDEKRLKEPVFAILSRETLIYLGSLVAVVVALFLVQYGRVVGYALGLTGIFVVAYLVWFMVASCSRDERGRMWVALVLTFFSIVFWAFFEQAGSSINLFTERNVDRSLFGWEIKTSMFQSVNPAFIILLAPLFAALWGWLDRRDLEPNIPVKFGFGLVQLGLGFGAFWLGAQAAGPDGMVPLIWLVLGYLLHTTGELCLSPVGLSMITKLSVSKIVGMMMGTWFLATAGAQYVGGLIAQLTGVEGSSAAGVVDPAKSIGIYGSVFGQIALFAMITGAFVLLVSPLLKRGMHGVK